MLTEQKGIQVDKFYAPVDWQYSFPEGYTRLEYLQSSGTQYIDTGYVPDDETGLKVSIKDTNLNADRNFLGCRISDGQRFVLGWNNNTWGFGFNSFVNTNITAVQNIKNEFSLNYNNSRKFEVNGESVNITDTITGTLPNITLFGQNGITLFAYKIYSCQITQGNQLVRNFVPVKRNSDNKPGMYDLVNNVFYVNQGTGEFVMGPELYLNNSQIDIRQKNNTNFVEKYKFNENNELVWANPQLNLSGPVGYTKVGNPTITDNVASGFSSGNYLKTASVISSLENMIYVVKAKTTKKTTQRPIGYSTNNNASCGPYFYTNGTINLIVGGLPGNLVTITTNYQYELDTWYWIKVVHTSNSISLYISTDGLSYTLIGEKNNVDFATLNFTNRYISLGGAILNDNTIYSPLSGSIDLKETYIKVNDKLWFYGKNYTSENYAPVPAGLNYNNTTTPSIGYVNTQTQEFIPAPTDGIKYSQTRDIKVIPPEDNTITLLYGVKSDFSKYSLFGLLAQVSSGTYDVYIDDVLYATTASGTQTDIDFSTLGSEYVPIGTATTPEELVLHKIVIKPNTNGATITQFQCKRNSTQTGIVQQGVLWGHFELDNILSLCQFALYNNSQNRLLTSVTAKNNILNMSNGSNFLGQNTDLSGTYKTFNIKYIPNIVLTATSGNVTGGMFNNRGSLKRVNLMLTNNLESGDLSDMFSGYNIEQINIKGNLSVSSRSINQKLMSSCYKLKMIPKINMNNVKYSTPFITYAQELHPTKLNFDNSDLLQNIQLYGSSTYPMRGLRGLKVSNEAPFTGTSPQINVSYTGLDRDALVELFESMPGYMKLDKVGEPTIDSNGVVSGFSSSNYLTLQQNLDSDLEMVIDFTTGASIVGNQVIFMNRSVFDLEVRSSGGLVSYNWQNSTYKSVIPSIDYSVNTNYKVKIIRSGNTISCAYSKNGGAYISTATYTTKKTVTNPATFGTSPVDTSRYFNGSIDLKNSYITINNARYQFQLPDDTTTRAINITAATGNNLTKVGTPTIDANGVASGFSQNDYIRTNENFLATYTDYEIILKTKITTNNAQYLFCTGNGDNGYLQCRISNTYLRFMPYTFSNYVELNFNLQLNTWYWFKIKRKGNNISLQYSQDNIIWSDKVEKNFEQMTKKNAYFEFGVRRGYGYFNGSIDLENTYIKVGQNYLMKGQILDSDRAIATGKGWGITG